MKFLDDIAVFIGMVVSIVIGIGILNLLINFLGKWVMN